MWLQRSSIHSPFFIYERLYVMVTRKLVDKSEKLKNYFNTKLSKRRRKPNDSF